MRINIEDSKSFLTEVYVVDFGDNYHRLSDEPSTELEREARKIRRKYKNIAEYMNALAVYREYMALLALKHGGPELFKIKLKNDLIEDFVPPKPTLKKNKINKLLLKKKIIVSRAKVNKIDKEKLEEIIKSNEENKLPLRPDLVKVKEKVDPVAKKIIKKDDFNKVSLKKVKNISHIDFLEEYFRTKNKMENKDKESTHISLSKIASGEYEDLIKDTREEDEVIFYRGNYMNRETVQDLQMYQQLGELGWNSLKIMKDKGVSKRITKILKNQNKKNKKKKKKKKKKVDDFLVQVMVDNDYDSFEEYEREMLDFTAKNIFGK